MYNTPRSKLQVWFWCSMFSYISCIQSETEEFEKYLQYPEGILTSVHLDVLVLHGGSKGRIIPAWTLLTGKVKSLLLTMRKNNFEQVLAKFIPKVLNCSLWSDIM